MPLPRSTSLTLPTVAACVGGLLDLDIIAQGLSVRLGVIEPLQADVFVAGTLNASVAEVVRGGAAWARRIALGREHIAALEPFLKAFEVERQLSGEEMRAALERSGFGPAFARQVSGAGAGRLDPNHEDPRQWLPTMLSPAFGNPQGNTLREFHYQSRCMHMIERAEAERRAEYSRVLFTRLEFLWLHAHPPLSLLDPSRVWVPAVEDNGGVNDRHWLVSRRDAPTLMRRWEALLDGSALSAIHGSRAADGHAGVRPRFLSSEMFLFEYARYHRLPIGRFPVLAYLACCEDIYRDAQGRLIGSDQSSAAVLATGDGYERKARTCFQPHCNRKRCPAAPPLHERSGAGERKGAGAVRIQLDVPSGDGMCSFKYDDEGSASVINAELLAMPGARLMPADGPPARLEIAVGEGASPSRLYFCRGCHDERWLTPVTNLTEGCLFLSGVAYAAPEARRAVAEKHLCRYFDVAVLRRLCDSFSRPGDRPDHRGKTYAEQYFPFWCRGLPEA